MSNLRWGGQIFANHDLENNIITYCNSNELELADYLTLPNDGVPYEYLWKIDSDNDGSFEYDLDDFSTDPNFSFTPSNLSVGQSLSVNLVVRDPDGFSCSYASNISTEARKIPLGHSITVSETTCFFTIYVPTKYESTLKITSAGSILSSYQVANSSNSQPVNQSLGTGYSIAILEEQYGWWNFKIENSSSTWTISSEFTQSAIADKIPWNFYFWADQNDPPNQPALHNNDASFPDLRPLYKYDLINNSTNGESARLLEEICCSVDETGYDGHCDGLAKASIFLNEPDPHNPSEISAEELKGLYGEVFEGTTNWDPHFILGYTADKNASDGKATAGYDVFDKHAKDFHFTIERHINGRKKAVYANLGSIGGNFGDVWNHAMYVYEATYTQHDLAGGEKLIKIDITVTANADEDFGGGLFDPTIFETERIVQYSYVVEYANEGEVDWELGSSNWISVAGSAEFIPERIAAFDFGIDDLKALLGTEGTYTTGEEWDNPPNLPNSAFKYQDVFDLDQNNQ